MKIQNEEIDPSTISKIGISHGDGTPTKVSITLKDETEKYITAFTDEGKTSIRKEYEALLAAISN
jgi:biotin-(acetyl-CoA carboxylase) ligase